MARTGEPGTRNLDDEIADTVSRVRSRSAGLIARAAEEGWSDGRLHEEIRREFEMERGPELRPDGRSAATAPPATAAFAPPPRPGRYRVDIPVDCTTRDAFFSNRVMNLSRGGLFLRSDSPLPLQAEVDLEFTLPETGATIQARGRVIWNYDVAKCSSHIVAGSGIKFVDLSPADRARLEDCLARLALADAPPPTPGEPTD